MMMQIIADFDRSTFTYYLWETVGVELCLFALTCLGFLVFRSEAIQSLLAKTWCFFFHTIATVKPGLDDKSSDHVKYLPLKQLETNYASGHFDEVLSAWTSLKMLSIDGFLAVVHSLLAKERHVEVPEIIRKALSVFHSLRSTEALDALLQGMLPEKLSSEQIAEACRIFSEFSVDGQSTTYELLLPSIRRLHASQAIAFLASTSKSGKAPACAYEVLIKALVKAKKTEPAFKYVLAMHNAGHSISSDSLTPVLVLAATDSTNAVHDLIEKLPSGTDIQPDCLAAIVEHALKASNIELLRSMHHMAGEKHISLTASTYESLIHGYASIGDVQAVQLFEDMINNDFVATETFLVALISTCADAKHIQMAERAAQYCREKRGRLSLAMYSALMKVYSHAKMFHKACDLHEQLVTDGIKLDTVAYGCLIRCAVEAGRLELSRQLFRESGNPDLLNYMSLIRAAGRERNVQKALALLKDLEQSPIPPDTTAYNCVLDVCVACGDMQATQKLFKQMQDTNHVDVISYNTFLKGLLSKNASQRVSPSQLDLLLQEMRTRDLKPNAVTYNSLINGAVSRANLVGAWQYVEDMESQGVNIDAFTCSILMKGVKASSRKDDFEKTLALIERANVVPDEVLVNSLLDACVRLRNGPLLSQVLKRFKATGVVPSMHAYATLIKAYGHAQQLDQVRAVWQELTEDRKITPNEEIFGCMADACVSNGDISGAVGVLRSMERIIPNSPQSASIFSGLIRACLQRKDTKRALELYDEIGQIQIVCSLNTYNMLIDNCARAGDMSRVSQLFRDMCQNNVSPDLVSYSTIIKGYCVKGDLEPALQLFTLMRKRGIKPDAILFNSILDGCAHRQMRTLTEQVLSDMEEEGIAPSNFTVSILVKLFGRCGDLDQAFDVVQTYPKRYGFAINAQVYTCLMSACISNGKLSQALSVLEQMQMADCDPDAKTYQTLLSGCIKADDLDTAVKIVDEAIARNPAMLDTETVDNLFFIISKRSRTEDLGQPLIDRLRRAGFAISKKAMSLLSGQKVATPSSRFHARRDESSIH